MMISNIGVMENITVDVCTPIGTIKIPARIEKIDFGNCGCKDADFNLLCKDKRINLNLAVLSASEDMNEQNQRAESMERKFNQHQGRYIVKDMAIKSVSVDENGIFNLYFVWTDCYGDKRIYRGCACKLREAPNGLYLQTRRTQFYF
jgi:hypothetical protein